MVTILERIAAALERQVEQTDSQVRKVDAAREANLARHHSERAADTERYNQQHAENMREMAELRKTLDVALAKMDAYRAQVEEVYRRVAAMERTQMLAAVDPAVRAQHSTSTREGNS
jgi:hypothetical protein